MGMLGRLTRVSSFLVIGMMIVDDLKKKKKLMGIYPCCNIFTFTLLIFCFSQFDLIIKSCA